MQLKFPQTKTKQTKIKKSKTQTFNEWWWQAVVVRLRWSSETAGDGGNDGTTKIKHKHKLTYQTQNYIKSIKH